jgi:flagellar biosynthesis protein FlhG
MASTYPPPSGTLPPPPMDFGGRPRARRTIAVGGGRGGTGKTLLAVNLGVYLAQIGREVALCDADPFGSSLHAVLGLDRPPLAPPRGEEEGLAALVPTTVPGLSLLPTPYDPMTATPVRRARGARWLAELGELPVDYVIINLGASTSAAALDLLLFADIGVCVTAPEPLAVETTYGVCRALFARCVRRALMKERFKLRVVERAISELHPLASPPEIVAQIKRYDDYVARVVAAQMARVRPHLVVGQTRLRSDLELGPAMLHIAERFLGITLDYLGHIEQDDAVWLTARRRLPVLVDSPTSKSARNIERLARRMLAFLAAQESRGAELALAEASAELRGQPPKTLYDVLSVSRTAADDDIRRAYKRQREIYREGSLPIMSVVGESALRAEQARIEEAYDTLLDPMRRRAYDLSAFPDTQPVSVAPARITDDATRRELFALQAEVSRELSPETDFTGELLRRVRESQGVEIAEIAQRTKISGVHLAALESESVHELPAFVYVQGFVKQYAQYLKLDAAQVAKTYMRRFREIAASRGGTRGG